MKALVTGGTGFLGGAIVRGLLAQGAEVRVLARTAGCVAAEVEQVQGDLADLAVVEKGVAGCDVVFHVAAKAGVWGDEDAYYRTNVLGTENIVSACLKHGVPKLIYTSTPSVVFDGTDEEGIDESAPYAERFLCAYPRTKARAEKHVLAANDGVLATVALRPHLIWGPGDNHLVPRLVERARQARLRLVGSGANRVDSTYIDNAADAHLLAAQCLSPGAACAGKAYFISNEEPLPMEELVNRILSAAGAPPANRRIPEGIAYGAGFLLEAWHHVLGRIEEPVMTRFLARQLARAHWFDCSAAQRDLGYRPKVSIEEGLRRLAEAQETAP